MVQLCIKRNCQQSTPFEDDDLKEKPAGDV